MTFLRDHLSVRDVTFYNFLASNVCACVLVYSIFTSRTLNDRAGMSPNSEYDASLNNIGAKMPTFQTHIFNFKRTEIIKLSTPA